MLWILDTDHISLFQRGNPTVTRNIQSKLRSELVVTIVSYEEQIRGWLKVVSRSFNDLEQLTFGYNKLNENLDFYRTKTVLDFNAGAATEFQNLLRQKVKIGTQDLKIAALAKPFLGESHFLSVQHLSPATNGTFKEFQVYALKIGQSEVVATDRSKNPQRRWQSPPERESTFFRPALAKPPGTGIVIHEMGQGFGAIALLRHHGNAIVRIFHSVLVNGSNNIKPLQSSKSFTLRVASVNSWCSAVAAIKMSA